METEAPRRRGRPRKDNLEGQPVEAVQSERPPMRTEMRERDPRAEAERRAAEILGHVGSMDEGVDDFYIDPSKIPDGWTYEWKRKTVAGAEDPAYQISLARAGWEPVPTSRHPSYMPDRGDYPVIERKGMVLMERPTELVEEARSIELKKARGQVRAKEVQLAGTPDGTMARDRPKISKSYEAIPIPKE